MNAVAIKKIGLLLAALIVTTGVSFRTQASSPSSPTTDDEWYLDRQTDRMSRYLRLDREEALRFEPLYRDYLEELLAWHPHKYNNRDGHQSIEERIALRKEKAEIDEKYLAEFRQFLNEDQLEIVFDTPRYRDDRPRYGRHYNNRWDRYNRHEDCCAPRGPRCCR